MARKSMSYGVLPTKEEFDAAFDEECPSGQFRFGNDPIVGNSTLTCDELWEELQYEHEVWETAGNEESGDWCSSVLTVLGFEWI